MSSAPSRCCEGLLPACIRPASAVLWLLLLLHVHAPGARSRECQFAPTSGTLPMPSAAVCFPQHRRATVACNCSVQLYAFRPAARFAWTVHSLSSPSGSSGSFVSLTPRPSAALVSGSRVTPRCTRRAALHAQRDTGGWPGVACKTARQAAEGGASGMLTSPQRQHGQLSIPHPLCLLATSHCSSALRHACLLCLARSCWVACPTPPPLRHLPLATGASLHRPGGRARRWRRRRVHSESRWAGGARGHTCSPCCAAPNL